MRMDFDPKQSEGGYEDVEIDWSQVELPAWMEARINHEALKQTKAGNGRYLQVAFKVTSGVAAGGTVWGQFTVMNPSAKAVEIGREQIGELGWACGLGKGADSSALKGKRLQIRVAMESSDRFGDRPKPVAFKPIGRIPGTDPGVDPDLGPDDGYPAERGQGPSPAGAGDFDEDPDDPIPF